MRVKLAELSLDSTEHDTTEEKEATEVKRNSALRKSSKKKMKRVTFVSDAHLVSVREIPARPSSSISYSTESSAESEESDVSSSDVSESSDSDDSDTNVDTKQSNVNNNNSKTKLHNTPKGKSKKKSTPKPKVKQPPNLQPRTRRLSTPIANPLRHRTLGQDKKENSKEPTFSIAPSYRYNPENPTRRRPLSSSGIRTSQQPSSSSRSPSRPSSAVPLINLRLVSCRASETYTQKHPKPASPRKALREAIGRYKVSNMPNSGQERTKLYAWQVANGAPLVTTPGITPFCSEQTTITKL